MPVCCSLLSFYEAVGQFASHLITPIHSGECEWTGSVPCRGTRQ